jgi:hypothetical protein
MELRGRCLAENWMGTCNREVTGKQHTDRSRNQEFCRARHFVAPAYRFRRHAHGRHTVNRHALDRGAFRNGSPHLNWRQARDRRQLSSARQAAGLVLQLAYDRLNPFEVTFARHFRPGRRRPCLIAARAVSHRVCCKWNVEYRRGGHQQMSVPFRLDCIVGVFRRSRAIGDIKWVSPMCWRRAHWHRPHVPSYPIPGPFNRPIAAALGQSSGNEA